jgi:peptide chain release factor subunit 1
VEPKPVNDMSEHHSVEKMKMMRLLKELQGKRGRHTELVSVYVPAGYDLNNIASQLRSEQGTAENIKSKGTRKNVVTALERILQHIRIYKGTPKNGLVLFCGNVSEKEGVDDIQLWAFEPPEPIEVKMYWCDQKFVLEPLLDLYEEKEQYGLLVLDKNEATFGLLKGTKIKLIRNMESIVPGKTRAGGQSSARFGRVRDALLNDFLKEVGDNATQIFLNDLKILKGVIIGGPGPIKEQFIKEGYVHYQIQQKIIGPVSTSYTGEFGLEELVERAKDLLAEAKVTKEKEIVQKLFEELRKESGLAVIGFDKVVKALNAGAADKVLLSEGSDLYQIEYLCSNGHSEIKTLKQPEIDFQRCPTCGTNYKVMGKKPMDEYLQELSHNIGATLIVISRDTKEGSQLYEIGAVAAILRYRMG